MNYKKNITKKQKALNLLFNSHAYPGLVQRKYDEVRLILWHNNTQGDFTSWTIFETNGNYFIRRVIWKQHTSYDLKEPQTYASELMIAIDTINQLLTTFDSIDFNTFKSIKPITVIIDGVRYGIVQKDKIIEWSDQISENMHELNLKYKNALKIISVLYPL